MYIVPSILARLLVGCHGGEAPDEATQDVKVDHNGKEEPVESVSPRLCNGGLGKVYAAWQDERGEDSDVRFNLSDDAGITWLPSDVPINDSEAKATAVDLACAGDHVYVVWEDERDGDLRYHNIYVDVSTDGGRSWGEEDILLDGDVEGEAMSLSPRIVATGNDAYVTWFDARDGAYDIYLQATNDGGETWLSEPTRVDTDPAGESYSASPQIVADADGRVVVAWEDSRSGASDIYVNVSNDSGATFGDSDQRLDLGDDAGSANSFLPSLAVAGDNVYVVWHDERNGENRDIYLNRSSDGGETWEDEAIRVDSDAAGQADSLNPAVAAIGDRLHVVWQDDRSGGYDIFHRVSRDAGATWEDEERRMDTDSSGESQSYEPVIRVQKNTVVVAWQDRRADAEEVGFNDLYYNYSADGGTSWAMDDIRINSNKAGTAYAMDQGMAVVDGTLVTLWADGRFGTSDIFCASRALGEASKYVEPEPEPEEE